MSDIRVGPTYEHCNECGGTNDGYSAVVHYDGCSKAPKGKAAKAHPKLVREEDLPPFLRQRRVHKADRDEAEE